MRLLITAGGTGGHVYPALTVAAKLPGSQILWIGSVGGMERELVTREGIEFETIHGGAVVGVGALGAIIGLIKLALGTMQAFSIVNRFKPEALYVTGGFTAIPVTLVCWVLRIPILVYLPDIEPGSAVKLVARFAATVAVTAEESRMYFPKKNVVVTGYPLRGALFAATREAAQLKFGLSASRQTLLVFGGSRGARSINLALLDILDDLLDEIQIIHISGELDWETVQTRRARLSESKMNHYHAFPYLHEDMALAFAASDLVVCRAGASSLGEFPMMSLAAILVPYPHAWRYQKVNADYLAGRGAAIRLNDEDLKTKLLTMIQDVMRDTERLSAMRQAARVLAVPDAADRIAAELLKFASHSP